MQSLLNMDEFLVEEFTVRGNPKYKADKVESDVKLSFSLKRKGKEPFFMMPMTIDVNKTKKFFSSAPYYIFLRITGFFSFLEGTDEETIKRMIGLNGLAILYGVAMGTVAQATANCLHGKFLLPSVNFVELLKAKATSKPSGKRRKKVS